MVVPVLGLSGTSSAGYGEVMNQVTRPMSSTLLQVSYQWFSGWLQTVLVAMCKRLIYGVLQGASNFSATTIL